MFQPEDKALIKETLIAARFGLALFLGFWIAGWLGAPILLLYVAATGLILGFNIARKNPPQEMLEDFGWLTLIIILASWLGYWLGGSGLLGLLILAILFSFIILFRRRKLYMDWIYHIEERYLYGKRLRRKRK